MPPFFINWNLPPLKLNRLGCLIINFQDRISNVEAEIFSWHLHSNINLVSKSLIIVFWHSNAIIIYQKYEPRSGKTGFLHLRKQRRRSASRQPRSWSAPLFSLHRQYNSPSSLIRNFKSLAIFSDCPAKFVPDLDGNPEDWFSQNKAHMVKASPIMFP